MLRTIISKDACWLSWISTGDSFSIVKDGAWIPSSCRSPGVSRVSRGTEVAAEADGIPVSDERLDFGRGLEEVGFGAKAFGVWARIGFVCDCSRILGWSGAIIEGSNVGKRGIIRSCLGCLRVRQFLLRRLIGWRGKRLRSWLANWFVSWCWFRKPTCQGWGGKARRRRCGGDLVE